MYFPVSGVEVFPLFPVIVAFIISFFTSLGGVSGAFLLLPFQVSVLGFVSPSVSSTNLVYNIVAIPSGVYRYVKEGRMAWPLAWVIIVGTLPGVFIGAVLRVLYLPDPENFKVFVGCVLLYVGARMLYDLKPKKDAEQTETTICERQPEKRLPKITGKQKERAPHGAIRTVYFSLTRCSYEFSGEVFSFSPWTLFVLTFVVGIIGGTYGIGGGSIIAPFLMAIFKLPVYTIAGAALLGTFITSIAGVTYYSLIAPYYSSGGISVAPDWLLGTLFGMGGFMGMYCGARAQKYVPAKIIKLIIGFAILFLSIRYVSSIFW